MSQDGSSQVDAKQTNYWGFYGLSQYNCGFFFWFFLNKPVWQTIAFKCLFPVFYVAGKWNKFCFHNPSITVSTLPLHLDQMQKFHTEAEWRRFIHLWNEIYNKTRFVTGSYQHSKSWHIVGRESENSGIVFALSLTSLCVLRLVSSVWYGECFGGGRKLFHRQLPSSVVSSIRSVRSAIDSLFYVTIPVFSARSKTNKLFLRLLRTHHCQVLSALKLLMTAILDLWLYFTLNSWYMVWTRRRLEATKAQCCCKPSPVNMLALIMLTCWSLAGLSSSPSQFCMIACYDLLISTEYKAQVKLMATPLVLY